ncbi:MAG: alpha/beta hydrolase [Anaerolineae bacterium]|nr:alpha/beta hydrolase [Anaerolineae bacterium]MCI0608249.1 alpha/beta hydrolase [Anaerolineae bacterium]
MDNLKLEETFITTNGIRLHTVMAGPQSGIPVILLHGFPENWRSWIRQLPALVDAGCRVIMPDQRGYNLSDKPKGVKNYRISLLVDDIAGLIDALEYDKVNLIGHDWGAGVAWMLALWHPERLHRLGILNVPHPAVIRRFLQRDLEQLRRSWYIFFFQLPWLPEAGMRADDWRGAVRALRGSGKIHTFTNEDIEKYKEAWSQPGAMTAMINWYRAAVRYQIQMPEDPRVKVPTLMLWGMKDFALSHRMARPSMDYCDEGNLILFPDATHWVQLDEAEAVNHYMLDFLLDKISTQVIR